MKMTPKDPQSYSHGLNYLPFYLPACFAAVISFGQLLLSDDPLSWKQIFGKTIVGSGIGMSAYSLLALIPDLPPVAVAGLACGLTVFGAEGLIKFLRIWSVRIEAKDENKNG